MKYQPADLITGFYADDTLPWSSQDICNWLPHAAEQKGTRTQVMAKTPPGLSPLVEKLSDGVSVGPVRGLYEAEGRLFTVMGSTLYQLSNSIELDIIGTIPGTGRVRFAHNKIDQGNQILAVNGSSGYVYNTVTSVFEKITDTGYPGAIDAVFIDGYLIQIEPARRFAFHSNLSDALDYNTLDRFTSEVSPDLLVALTASNNELLLFSETSTEFFHNTGATVQPFRSKRISFDKGCAGRYCVATVDNTVHWLGSDGMFYRLNGYSPQRISTHAIEQAIRGLNWAQAFAFIWETEGHSVVYWTFPDGQTFGFDTGQPPGLQWHRRASYGLDRWRVNDTAYWRGDWIASDFQRSRLWTVDWSYAPMEGDTAFVSEITGATIHDNQNRVFMPYAELLFATGEADVTVRTFPAQPAEDDPVFLDGLGVAYTGEVTALTTLAGTWPTLIASSGSGTNPSSSSNDGLVVAGRQSDNALGIWRYSQTLDTYIKQSITGSTPGTGSGSVYGTAVSSTGKWVLVSSNDQQKLYVYEYSGGSYVLRETVALGVAGWGVCFSPAGTRVAQGLGGNIVNFYDFDINTGELTFIKAVSGCPVQRLDWKGDYVMGCGSTTPKIIDFDAGTVVATLDDLSVTYVGGVWTGTIAYLCGTDGAALHKVVSATFNGTTFVVNNTYTPAARPNSLSGNKDRTAIFVSTVGTHNLYTTAGIVMTPVTPAPTGNEATLWTNLP